MKRVDFQKDQDIGVIQSHNVKTGLTQLLAPDIQEAILFLPPTTHGRDRVLLRDLQTISLTPDWCHQRKQWTLLLSEREIDAKR